MLPKPKRLNLKKDFKWVASGKRIYSKYATIFTRLGDNSFPKIGIAVPSKVFKSATLRNRARRLLSKGFEDVYSKLPNSINIVALPKEGILDVKSSDLLIELESVLKKA